VVAELICGASLSAKAGENMARVEHLTELLGVLPFSEAAARIFGRLKTDLRRRGLAKSDFDLAIAAIALERTAVLVTADHAFASRKRRRARTCAPGTQR
jgi:tRNA(fMet)-specific endonuclease VapC